MAKYRKKPVIIEAVQWFKHGDYPDVNPYDDYLGIAKGTDVCRMCGKFFGSHGYIEQFAEKVCPGDYIVEEGGKMYPRKPDIFEATYEKMEE